MSWDCALRFQEAGLHQQTSRLLWLRRWSCRSLRNVRTHLHQGVSASSDFVTAPCPANLRWPSFTSRQRTLVSAALAVPCVPEHEDPSSSGVSASSAFCHGAMPCNLRWPSFTQQAWRLLYRRHWPCHVFRNMKTPSSSGGPCEFGFCHGAFHCNLGRPSFTSRLCDCLYRRHWPCDLLWTKEGPSSSGGTASTSSVLALCRGDFRRPSFTSRLAVTSALSSAGSDSVVALCFGDSRRPSFANGSAGRAIGKHEDPSPSEGSASSDFPQRCPPQSQWAELHQQSWHCPSGNPKRPEIHRRLCDLGRGTVLCNPRKPCSNQESLRLL